MPGLGSLNPFPFKLGGGRSRVRAIVEQLAADRGTALDATNPDTVAYAECLAIARQIAAAWSTNQRLANVWDPARMSVDILERWEAFLALNPSPSATVAARRTRLAEHFARFGRAAVTGELSAALEAAIGDAFVAIEHISFANAQINVPDGTYPWGSVGTVPWSSTVCHVLVRLQKPTGWTEGEFYAAAAEVGRVLDPILPAWATFDWYRPGPVSVVVSGGPSAGGFYLDDDANLDNQVFDV